MKKSSPFAGKMGNVFSYPFYGGQEESGPSDFTSPAHQKVNGTESINSASNHNANDCKKKTETPDCNPENNAVEQVKKGLHRVKVRTLIQTHSLYI